MTVLELSKTIVFATAAGAIGLALLTGLFLLLRLSIKRAVAMRVKPARGDIWQQDGEDLFVLDVTDYGVKLSTLNPVLHELQLPRATWSDSWDEWSRRARARIVIRTARKWA